MPITSNLNAFNAKINAWLLASQSGDDITTIQRKLTMDAMAQLTKYTPRDTGYLAFNWFPSVNAPMPDVLRGVKGKQNPLPEVVSPQLTPYGIVYVQNNVEYAEYVNNGTPRMEGRFMVERTLQDLSAGLT
mgnify:FL=1|tara:strand:+ start:10727 stop:11119 length:393 start_codon:yes stop_codon:yes gene_type:complete